MVYKLYLNTSHFFKKGKGSFKYVNTGYCIHLDLEFINIKVLFEILPRPGQLPGFPKTPLYHYDSTQKPGLNQVYNSVSFTSSQHSCWVLSVLLRKCLMHRLFPMSTTSALVQSPPPFNCQPPSNGSLTSTQGACLPLTALSLPLLQLQNCLWLCR